MCEPETPKLPPLPVTTPVSTGFPSPQSIVAEYWAAVAVVSGSVKVATWPLNGAPSTAPKTTPAALIGWSGAASDSKKTSGSGRPVGQLAFVTVFRSSPQR